MTKSNRARRLIRRNRIVDSDLARAAVHRHVRHIAEVLKQGTQTKALRAQWNSGFENVYRVMVDPNTGCVEVVCLGIDSVDSEAEGTYSDTSKLPQWLQEKLAVLAMIKVDPPQTKVDGVGMRVDDDVYWVIKGE